MRDCSRQSRRRPLPSVLSPCQPSPSRISVLTLPQRRARVADARAERRGILLQRQRDVRADAAFACELIERSRKIVVAGPDRAIVERDAELLREHRVDARRQRIAKSAARTPQIVEPAKASGRSVRLASATSRHRARSTSAPHRRLRAGCRSALRARTLRSSSQPFANAAFSIAYSPLTWYANVGTPKRSFTRRTMSRYGSAGLTMTMSAPSSRSSAISRSASSPLAGSI